MNIDDIIRLTGEIKPGVIFVCNPNNPTGGYIGRNDFQNLLESQPDSLIILDEAYISFVRNSWNSLEFIDRGNLLVIRSLTKDYALAGLRLGYAAGSKDIINALRKICPPWNVNVVAQHAGIVALQYENFLKEGIELALNEKQFLIGELKRLGFNCLPSRTHFFLVDAGSAETLRLRLLRKGILVRDCASFGLPEYIRISPGTRKKNRKLVEMLTEIVAERA
jgi:histidinol-phosphate aminotransferase